MWRSKKKFQRGLKTHKCFAIVFPSYTLHEIPGYPQGDQLSRLRIHHQQREDPGQRDHGVLRHGVAVLIEGAVPGADPGFLKRGWLTRQSDIGNYDYN